MATPGQSVVSASCEVLKKGLGSKAVLRLIELGLRLTPQGNELMLYSRMLRTLAALVFLIVTAALQAETLLPRETPKRVRFECTAFSVLSGELPAVLHTK